MGFIAGLLSRIQYGGVSGGSFPAFGFDDLPPKSILFVPVQLPWFIMVHYRRDCPLILNTPRMVM